MANDGVTNADQGELNASFKWALVVFPAGIFILGFVSIVFYLNGGFSPDQELVRSEREIEAKRISGVMERLQLYSPERGFESEQTRLGLRRIFKMYESSLGERNAGYDVLSSQGFSVAGELWSALSVRIEPREPEAGYQVLALAATESDATHATALSILESMASNRVADTGLLFVLLPVSAGSGFDAELEDLVADLAEGETLRQTLILKDLGSSARLAYFGEIAGNSNWLVSGMTESADFELAHEEWCGIFRDTTVLILGARDSDERLDPVTQADLARELESMVRSLTGL